MITSLFFKLAEMLGFSIIHTYTNTSLQKKTNLIKVGEQQLKISLEIFWVFSNAGRVKILACVKGFRGR